MDQETGRAQVSPPYMDKEVLTRKLNQTFWIAFDMLRARYAATKFGLVWAIAQPTLMFLIFWFVSVFGLRLSGPAGMPYYAYLFGGLLPWITFSNAVSDGAGSLSTNRHLVRQPDFPLIVVPIAAVLSNLLLHLPLFVIVTLILSLNGIVPGTALFALPLCLLGLAIFALALAIPLSVLSIRSPDASQAVSVLLLLLFWLTPIIWPAENLPAGVLTFISLNPLFWVVEGYRYVLLSMPYLGSGAYFFYSSTIGLIVCVAGYFVFRRLRHHIGDYDD